MKRALLLCVTAVLLSACGSIPPLNFSVPNVGPSPAKLDAEVKSLTVTVARPDEKTGGLPPTAEGLAPLWKTSVEEALDRMAIFNDDASRKVSLSVKILKLEVPGAGLSMTTDAAARYEIIDRKTGSVIFTTDISSSGTTPLDFAFQGVARARESVNRAVQNNISQFLQQLQTVDLSKPMFPTAAVPAAASPKAMAPTS
ncbi:MAG TPA: hypothetical protein VKQ29_17675 [Aliidongia sp.]|nr:hypothetical protein [Aliidongia sp.]